MKRVHHKKELDQLQKIKRENDSLKKEVRSLRKQLAKIDLDRFSYVKETLEEHFTGQEEQENSEKLIEILKKHWKCDECGVGHLEIVIYNKMEESWYFRQCNYCNKRTRSKKYSPEVKGIVRKED